MLFLGSTLAAGELQPNQRQRFAITNLTAPVSIQVQGDGREWSLTLTPDKEGIALSTRAQSGAEETKGTLQFWPKPNDKRGLEGLTADKVPVQTWKDRTLHGYVERTTNALRVSVEGRLLAQWMVDASGPLKVTIGGTSKNTTTLSSNFEFLDLENLIKSGTTTTMIADGVPFEVWDSGQKTFPLSLAGWADWERDPGNYLETYDAGPSFLGDLRQPLVQIPKADYTAAYVLAKGDGVEGRTTKFTLRLGRRMAGPGEKGQVLVFDFPGDLINGQAVAGGYLKVIRVPLTEAFSQDIEDEILDLEITKEVRLARRAPDPGRFRWRPLGLPSGLEIAGVTLEKSPIQMVVTPMKTGALFGPADRVEYKVQLRNITSQTQPFEVKADEVWKGELAPGDATERIMALPEKGPGFHQAAVDLAGKAGPLLRRSLAFGVLPDLPQQYREESPFGTWDFFGYHFTPSDGDVVGTLFQGLGLRYAKSKIPLDFRSKYGLRQGQEMSVRMSHRQEDNLQRYRAFREENPDAIPGLMLFHEDSVSAEHATKVPDLFSELPPYKLNEKEKKHFDEMFALASKTASEIRKAYPDVKLHLGNGPLVIREEFYRNKFPAELFDTAGNENASFGRPPEAQPPDTIANNASLWMDRQMLDAYGYQDKSVSQCLETIYPGTNPGNLSYQTQADYFVRHVLHSLAWGIPYLRPGAITDMGNSYYYSNWGSSGFFTRRPNITPKPAALAMATLIRALDGAKFEGFFDTGSESCYLMKFRKKDGSLILPYWTVRGQRPISFAAQGNIENISANGVKNSVTAIDGRYEVTAKPSPQYLVLPVNTSLDKIALGQPVNAMEPEGKVTPLDALNRLSNWELLTERNLELEVYNPMTPRRKGDFALREVKSFEGRTDVIEVTPKKLTTGKPTTPMYAELQAKTPIALPDKPSELGLWINGNSGWGRIVFELKDASGQRWTSIGASAKGESAWMADWLAGTSATTDIAKKRADWNTEDNYGISRINFDGWRYVGFPLPGQYPGEGYHWPINSQWKWDKDGTVHYPLTLTKIIIELPEKVLHLTRFESPHRPTIYLSNLVAVEQDQNTPKSVPGDYTEDTQVTIN